MKKVFSILFYILTSIMITFVLLELFLPDQTIKILGFKGYAVVSNSMEPDINVGDIVIVTAVDPESLTTGDAITFYTYLRSTLTDGSGNPIYLKSVVTHYLGDIVTEADETIYKTYGIYNNPNQNFDNWVDVNGDPTEIYEDDIIGRVAFKIPYLGYVIIFVQILFQNPIFLGLIVLNIIIVVILIKVIRKKPKEA